jgi:CDP-glucose 4,6-dehydratase
MDAWQRSVEELVIDPKFWHGRRVFLTGHTGFKGTWASLLLRTVGADVYGFALPPEDPATLFEMAGVAGDIHHTLGDVRDLSALRGAVEAARPSVVIHMAAQSLVRLSYVEPVSTYATNVMGTVNLLETVRQVRGIEAVVVVTSDKCYENTGSPKGYRESDPMGGRDPYSNSKGCAELVTDAYRRSFYAHAGAAAVASGRAGNVVGGGDWARDRLVPDAMRAFIDHRPLIVRNPEAVRPWQHVLDPVMAYLRLAERLARDGAAFAEGWNFGPAATSEVSVSTIADRLVSLWGNGAHWVKTSGEHTHEAAVLKLNCTKSAARLGWSPLLDLDRALQLTVDWYRSLAAKDDMRAVTLRQIAGVLAGRVAGLSAAHQIEA